MNMTKVPCNECGCLIDLSASANFVTCKSCNTPLAVRRTESSVFTERAVGQTEFATAATTDKLASSASGIRSTAQARWTDLERQNELNRLETELNRLDLEWERDKEHYMVWARYGHRYVPSKFMCVFGAIIAVSFGALWTGLALSFVRALGEDGNGAPFAYIFPLFGVGITAAAVVQSVYAFRKAGEFERAKSHYVVRRDRLLDQIKALRFDE